MAAADVPLVDTLGRPVRDLRISVTDRCQTMVGIHRRTRQILRPARLPRGAAKPGRSLTTPNMSPATSLPAG